MSGLVTPLLFKDFASKLLLRLEYLFLSNFAGLFVMLALFDFRKDSFTLTLALKPF